MDAIIKKFPGSMDVSHKANRINKSDLGTVGRHLNTIDKFKQPCPLTQG